MITEQTYVRSHDHCEVMILYENGRTVDVYAYRDSLPKIPGIRWKEGKNPLFRHASNPAMAATYVTSWFNATD